MPHHAGIQQCSIVGPVVAVKGPLRRASPALDRAHRTLSPHPHPLRFQKRHKEHPLRGNERLEVYLTNTVEPIEPQANFLLPAVSAEVEAAQAVKEQPILVITGNPPYSGHSKNNGTWITEAVTEYRRLLDKLGRLNQSKWPQTII
jgi:hypothetical protein